MKNLLLILILLSTYTLNAQTWSWQMPQPTGNGLEDVKFVNSQTGYACGFTGTVLKTTNGGNNWLNINTGASYTLRSIFVFDSEKLIICGDSGKVLKTTNSGNNWTITSTAITGFLHSVTFVNANTGYIAGVGGLILKTTNQGLNWFNLNSSTGAILYSIQFANENTGYIGGGRIMLKTTNAGVNWINTNLIVNDPFGQVFDISVIDSLKVWGIVIFDRRVVYSSNGGSTWNYYDLILPSVGVNDNAYSISFLNAQTGYIATSLGVMCKSTDAGQNWAQDSTYRFKYSRAQVLKSIDVNPNYIYAVGGGGTIIKSTNSGSNYFLQAGYKNDLTDICFINDNSGFAVGRWGELYKTTNSGINWIQKNANTSKDLNSIVFTNSQTGYIAGDTGLVLKTTNSGENWFNLNPGRNNIFNDIYFINTNTGYLCGTLGLTMKTTNEGLNWMRLDSTDNDGLLRIYFINENTGITTTESYARRTTNGGVNWIQQTNVVAGITITFINENTGYIGGGTRIYKTTNSGANWTQIFSRSGWVFYGLHFENEMEGIGVGSGGGISSEILVKTTNGGLNWYRLFATNNDLFAVDFINDETGYIAGGWGNILKTTNGGLTFITNNENNITSEYKLKQNYPNPFNPETNFEFTIHKSGFVNFIILDITGKEVAVLINQELSPGEYKMNWDASLFSSGVYFYTLKTQKFSQTKKMILMK